MRYCARKVNAMDSLLYFQLYIMEIAVLGIFALIKFFELLLKLSKRVLELL